MKVTIDAGICPSCGENRYELQRWLNEGAEWILYPHVSFGQYLGGFWGKSENHLKAEQIIAKCSDCEEFFYG